MNIYDLISRAQKLRKETQLDSVSPDRVGGLHEDTLKYINEFQLLASSPSLHKIYASVSAMQSDKSPKSDLTGKPLKPGQLVVIVPANQTDATAGDVYRYDGPSGNTSAWTFVAKIGAVPADAELSATSTNPPQNKVVTEKLTELESERDSVTYEHTNGSSWTEIIPFRFKPYTIYELRCVKGGIVKMYLYNTSKEEIISKPNVILESGDTYNFFVDSNNWRNVAFCCSQNSIFQLIEVESPTNAIKSNRLGFLNGELRINLNNWVANGFWGEDGKTIQSDSRWQTTIVNVPQELLGKECRICLGYSTYYAVHCFIFDGENYTAIDNLITNPVDRGYSLFTMPQNAIRLHLSCETTRNGFLVATNGVNEQLKNNETDLSYLMVDLSQSGDNIEGYWDENGEILSDKLWLSKRFNVSKWVGRKIRIKAGYSTYYAAHCFIFDGENYIAIDSLADYIAHDEYAEFVVPNNAVECLFSYDKRYEHHMKVVPNLNHVGKYIEDYLQEQKKEQKKDIIKSYSGVKPGYSGYLSFVELKEMFNDSPIWVTITNIGTSNMIYGVRLVDNEWKNRFPLIGNTDFSFGPFLSLRPQESLSFYAEFLSRDDISNLEVVIISSVASDFEIKASLSAPKEDSYTNIIPIMGGGQLSVSHKLETYCHDPIIKKIQHSKFRQYIAIVYQSSETVYRESGTYENGRHHNIVLLLLNQTTGERRYKRIVSDTWFNDYYDGGKVEYTYNHSFEECGDELIIRFSGIVNGACKMFYKKFNLLTGELSAIDTLKISVLNNTSIDWSWSNYVDFMNKSYGFDYSTDVNPEAIDVAEIIHYGEYYYTIMASACNHTDYLNTKVPYVLMRSSDLITWEVVSLITSEHCAAETSLVIKDDVVYCFTREGAKGQYWFKCSLDGTLLNSIEKCSEISTKPNVCLHGNDVIAIINIPSGDTHFGHRNKVKVAKVTDELETLKESYNPTGYQYGTGADCNGALMYCYTSDLMGYNYDNGAGPCGPVCVQQIIL